MKSSFLVAQGDLHNIRHVVLMSWLGPWMQNIKTLGDIQHCNNVSHALIVRDMYEFGDMNN